MEINNTVFENPEAFYLLALLPFMGAYWWFYHFKKSPKVIHSGKGFISQKSWRNYFTYSSDILKLLAFILMVFALARPRSFDESVETISKEGIDIVISLDISSSMRALDFKPNRLEAAKNIAMDFVDGRKNDRVGLVIYAKESFTQCPITSDYKVVKNLIKDIRFGILEDRTAIGMGLATAVSRLKDSKAESKIIILLSDGVNNAGLIDPETATDLAVKFGIKVYTIAMGKEGMVPYPAQGFFGKTVTQMPSEIDKKLLRSIAKKTRGKFFSAENNQKLIEIYEEIEKLEKTEVQELKYRSYTEHFRYFLIAALALLFLDKLLQYTLLKSVTG
jgi:Ca-activated chloride channel family protein